MFKIHKQSQNLNIYKKSVQKLYDHKRDISRRIKYLKNIVGKFVKSISFCLFFKIELQLHIYVNDQLK